MKFKDNEVKYVTVAQLASLLKNTGAKSVVSCFRYIAMKNAGTWTNSIARIKKLADDVGASFCSLSGVSCGCHFLSLNSHRIDRIVSILEVWLDSRASDLIVSGHPAGHERSK